MLPSLHDALQGNEVALALVAGPAPRFRSLGVTGEKGSSFSESVVYGHYLCFGTSWYRRGQPRYHCNRASEINSLGGAGQKVRKHAVYVMHPGAILPATTAFSEPRSKTASMFLSRRVQQLYDRASMQDYPGHACFAVRGQAVQFRSKGSAVVRKRRKAVQTVSEMYKGASRQCKMSDARGIKRTITRHPTRRISDPL